MNKDQIRRNLRLAGIALLTSIVTLSAGYYIGDRGIAWFPTTFFLLLICLFSGLCCLLGSVLVAGAVRTTEKGRRVKKRVLFLCLGLTVVCSIYLIGCQFQQKTPLTSMPPDVFDTTVSAHLELLDSYDREMESLLNRLQASPILASDVPLSIEQETRLRQGWLSLYDYAIGLDQIRQFYQDWYRFDVSRSQRPRHVQSFLLWHCADVILYDKALRTIALIKHNSSAVKFLNAPHPDSAVGVDSFSRLQLDLFGTDCHSRIETGRLYAQWLRQGLQADQAVYSGACRPLWHTLDTRHAVLEQMGLIDRSKVVIDADFEYLRQGFSRVWFPLQKGVAEWMGDTRVRRAGQYLITPELRRQLNKRLEPGDILLSRKNWYMSNVGLPGFWPHAILYIGQPEKLTDYFDDPAVTAYLETISGQALSFEQYMSRQFPQKWLQYRAGAGQSDYHVIEAVKYGVLLNPLSGACGDYLAAFRPHLDKVAKAQAVIEAFSHVGKPYDFDFDFATDHALVCTELVWRSYQAGPHKQGIAFELAEIAGRKTLPANEIAKFYVQQQQQPHPLLDFVCFIDASEKDQTAYFSDEKTFIESVNRQKWSFLQE